MADHYTYVQELICRVSNKHKPFFVGADYKGGFDRYQQWLIAGLVCGAVVLPSSLVYGMTFLFMEPQVLCKVAGGDW